MRTGPLFLPVALDQWWMQPLFGAAATIVGGSLLVWDDTTIQIIGLFFGLTLLVSGAIRTMVGAIGAELPLVYRLYNVAWGAISTAVAVVCLRYTTGSAVLLALLVGVGLVVDGVTEFGLALISADRWIRRFGLAVAAAYALFGLTVLAWLFLSPSTFVLFGGACLVLIGGTQMIAALRSPASSGDCYTGPGRGR